MWQMQESHMALADESIRRETVLLNGRAVSLKRAPINGVLFEIQRALQSLGQLQWVQRKFSHGSSIHRAD
jgi:hypothetical protein